MTLHRRIILKTAAWAIAAACLVASAHSSPALAAEKVTVFAAASMKNALDAATVSYTHLTLPTKRQKISRA